VNNYEEKLAGNQEAGIYSTLFDIPGKMRGDVNEQV
jgi:hypothetical protein